MLFERLSRGWALTKASLHVLRLDTEILVLPVLSGVVMLLVAAGVFIPLVLSIMGGSTLPEWSFAAAFLVVYFVGAFVAIFFNTAVVAMATIRFDGGDPVVKDGLRTAAENWKLILQWALVAATVGLLLRLFRQTLQEKLGFLGGILGSMLEVAWGAVIYFVIPLLVYRKMGPVQAMRESWGMIKRTWGETVAGEVSMGLVFFALAAAGFLVLLGAMFLGSFVAFLAVLAGVLVYWVVLAVVYTAAQGILTAALYKYATTGRVPQGFDDSMMAHAVR